MLAHCAIKARAEEGAAVPRYLKEPELVLDPIWALPDHRMRALADSENSSARATELQTQ
jgi:hypothetical protein